MFHIMYLLPLKFFIFFNIKSIQNIKTGELETLIVEFQLELDE